VTVLRIVNGYFCDDVPGVYYLPSFGRIKLCMEIPYGVDDLPILTDI
jgi:hypothetical protein